ncbi:MAG: porin family protein [Bacteroidota bacterium]
MKTNSILILSLLLISTSLFSQNAFEIGLKGGLNLAQLKTGKFITTPLKDGQPWSYNGQVLKDNLTQSYDTRKGSVFGIYTRFGRKLYFGPELYVATKGGTIDLTKTNTNDPSGPKIFEAIRVSYTNIDLPLLIGYRMLRILRVNAGPVASFNVGSNQKLAEALKFYSNNNISDSFKKASYSYQVGAGLDVLKFGLDVRYEGSLSEVTTIQLEGTEFAPKAKGWLVTLSYRLL